MFLKLLLFKFEVSSMLVISWDDFRPNDHYLLSIHALRRFMAQVTSCQHCLDQAQRGGLEDSVSHACAMIHRDLPRLVRSLPSTSPSWDRPNCEWKSGWEHTNKSARESGPNMTSHQMTDPFGIVSKYHRASWRETHRSWGW